jgi:NDP-sugar pyrophosphorylase family protein
MEVLILAGGKAERLGAAAQGKPKPLVSVAGHPLAGYTIRRLAAAGVTRAILACSVGQENRFTDDLSGLGVEIVAVGEPEPLGRGGALRFAATHREEGGAVLAMNGDELLDLDYAALLNGHRETAAATIVVAQVNSPFGVVDLDDDDLVRGFREAPKLEHWVNAGVYVLSEEALDRLPERGDHEQSTFPALAEEGKLRAFRHTGAWLTVNTPKDLRRAEEYLAAHADWPLGQA